MFESLTLITICLTLFFFIQNQRLGLTAAVPKDPNNLVHFYCSECLGKLKALLPGSQVLALQPHSLEFQAPNSTAARRLQVAAGEVTVQEGDGPAQPVCFLGAEGGLKFEKLSETGLQITIQARTSEADHKTSVRLEVVFA